jgi:hypothetical protein
MDWIGDVIKALGGGIPAVLIIGLAGSCAYLFRELNTERRAHLDTAKMVIPLAQQANSAADRVGDELKDALTVLRQIHSEQLVERARQDAHTARNHGGRDGSSHG